MCHMCTGGMKGRDPDPAPPPSTVPQQQTNHHPTPYSFCLYSAPTSSPQTTKKAFSILLQCLTLNSAASYAIQKKEKKLCSHASNSLQVQMFFITKPVSPGLITWDLNLIPSGYWMGNQVHTNNHLRQQFRVPNIETQPKISLADARDI
jgi:hypothetical protein